MFQHSVSRTHHQSVPSLPLTPNNYPMTLKGVIRFVQCGVIWCDVFERDSAPAERVGQGGVGGVDGKHVALMIGCS